MANILGTLGEAVVLLRADGSKLSADMKKQKADLEKDLANISQKLRTTGTALTIGVTGPIVAMGVAAVAAGVKVDEAFDLIRAGTGATGDALKDLEGSFATVFASVPDDAAVVGQALADVNTRTGLFGQDLEKLTKQLLDLSRITNTDVNSNVAAATRVFGDWSIATQDQGESLDYLFKTSQQTGIEVTKLMTSLVQFGAPLRNLNFTFEESAALLGKWEKEGVNAELVLGSLRIATAEFAREGVPLRKGLEDTIATIQRLGPGAEAVSKAMEVFGTRAGPDMAAAILEGRFAIEDLIGTIKSSPETIEGVAEEVKDFGERWVEFQNKMTLALEPLGTALIEAGEKALPILVKLGEIVAGAVKKFTEMPGPIQAAGLAVLGLAAAAGPIMLAVGSMDKLVRVIQTLRLTELPGLSRAATSTNAALLRNTALFKTLGLAAISLGVGIAIAKNDMDKFLTRRQQEMELSKYEVKLKRELGESWEDYLKRVQEADALWKAAHGPQTAFTGGTVDLSKALGVVEKTTAGANTELTEYQKKIRSMADDILTKAIDEGKTYADILRTIGGTQKLTNEEVEQFNQILDAAVEKMRLTGDTAGPAFQKVYQAWLETSNRMLADKARQNPYDVLHRFAESGITGKEFASTGQQAWFDAMERDFKKLVEKSPFRMLQNLPIKITSLETPPSLMATFNRQLLQGFTGPGGFTEQLGPTVIQALTGGGSVSKSVGALAGMKIGESLTKTLSATLKSKLGSTFGGAISSFLPGLGTLLGPMIGSGVSAIAGFIGKAFGNETKKVREEFAREMGFNQLGSLYDDLRRLGGEGERLAHIGLNVVGRNDEAGNRKWMDDVRKFYDDVASKREDAAEKEALAAQERSDAQNKLQAAIEKYGFTIEELGPKWRAQMLKEQAEELILDYAMLTESGIDHDTVIRRMGKSMNDFFLLAKKTGTEIPEQMRPMLQRMVDMGLLLDENGDQITDLESSGVTFAKTMTQGFQSVVDEIRELIRVITGDLGRSIEDIPSPQITVGVSYRYDSFDPPLDSAGEWYDPEMLSEGGVSNWGSGTLAVLHNTEVVTPLDRLEEWLFRAGEMGSGAKSEMREFMRMQRDAFTELKQTLSTSLRDAVQGAQ